MIPTKTYFSYAPYEPKEVVGEVHKIQDGQILLDHIPFENSIVIDGFKQTNVASIPENTFYCPYGADQLYREASCIVYFNPIHNGQIVSVDYLQVGTIITAEDLNEIKEHLENDTIHGDIKYHLPPATREIRGGIRVGEGLEIIGDILSVAGTLAGGLTTISGGYVTIGGSNYTLQPANETLLGGVKIGDGLAIDSSGKLDVTVLAGNYFTLPAASETLLGGVMIGNNLTVDANGVLSATSVYTLPAASVDTLGGVKIGDGLTMVNEFLNLSLGTTPLTLEGAMWLQID